MVLHYIPYIVKVQQDYQTLKDIKEQSIPNAILINHKEIAKFDSLNILQEVKIKKLTAKLGNTAALAAKEHKQHEEDIKRIGAMSNNDITALFTTSFD